LDSNIPRSKKLKDFRDFAKNLIENEDGIIRSQETATRTKDQEDRLREKMREL